MPFKIATHGGRYLYVERDNQVQADHDYDMTRTPQDLKAAGSVFDKDEKNRIINKQSGKPVSFAGSNLLLEPISSEESVIRTERDHRYLYAGLDSLRIEDEPDSMAMFTVVDE